MRDSVTTFWGVWIVSIILSGAASKVGFAFTISVAAFASRVSILNSFFKITSTS